MKKKIYFTFRSEFAGFTDSLTQFSAWYKLGRSLGYQYAPQPLNCNRSDPRVLDFLGFETIWKDHAPYPGDPDSKIELPWLSSELRFPYTMGFTGLLWFIRKKVSKAAETVKGDYLLVEFGLGNVADRDIFDLIERAIPVLPDGINLREKYFARSVEAPRADPYRDRKPRVLVHIRLGDATVIPTPWGSYLGVRANAVAEFPDLDSGLPANPDRVQKRAWMSLRAYVEPHDYFKYLRTPAVQSEYGSGSIVVSSDGFARTFDAIAKAADELGFSSNQRTQLDALRTSYERSQFDEFEHLENTRLQVGETEEKLFDLIHAALTADVIVTSLQQRMMSKFLRLYGRDTNPPTLVVLNRGGRGLAYLKRQLGNRVSCVVSVNTEDLEHPGVVFS